MIDNLNKICKDAQDLQGLLAGIIGYILSIIITKMFGRLSEPDQQMDTENEDDNTYRPDGDKQTPVS